MGKLIAIEGVDSAGKATHTNLLLKHLQELKKKVRKVEFPNYKSDSSALVKMYLSGEFGANVNSVSPYAASVFYTVDRFATYKTDMEEFYENDGIVLCDRYTTSNMIHQASKISDLKERDCYLNWLCDFEYRIFHLPKPDAVIFLDMPPDISRSFMEHRPNKMTGGSKKDIHEVDFNYLLLSYQAANYAADKYGWVRINCVKDDVVRRIESIQNDIFEQVKHIIGFELA